MGTMSARDFNQDVSAAKRSAASEPVIITDRGRPSHVLLSIKDYQGLMADRKSIVDWLSTDDDIDLPDESAVISLAVPDL